MADDLSKRGQPDRSKINMNEDFEVRYWTKQLGEGKAVAFGPVADPKGGWGLGVVELQSADEVKTFEANDPAIQSNLGFRYEVLPMVRAIVRAK